MGTEHQPPNRLIRLARFCPVEAVQKPQPSETHRLSGPTGNSLPPAALKQCSVPRSGPMAPVDSRHLDESGVIDQVVRFRLSSKTGLNRD
jgi:hypothetical protein